jgi:hypothetical protein
MSIFLTSWRSIGHNWTAVDRKQFAAETSSARFVHEWREFASYGAITKRT